MLIPVREQQEHFIELFNVDVAEWVSSNYRAMIVQTGLGEIEGPHEVRSRCASGVIHGAHHPCCRGYSCLS